MKKFLCLFLMVFVARTALAGTCEYHLSSVEHGRLNFMDYKKVVKEQTSLEDCIHHAKTQLGKKTRATTLIRDEIRKNTSVRYKFSDNRIHSSGTIRSNY